MGEAILITGISGVGKSTISKKLNEKGYKSYDMDDEPDLFSMVYKGTSQPVKNHDNEDLEKVMEIDWNCDIEKLASIIENETVELSFYCGNASNINQILPLFSKMILLKAGPEIVRQRLTARTENDFGRTSEVQDWIMTWKDSWENEMKEKGAIVIDAHKNVDGFVEEIINKITGK